MYFDSHAHSFVSPDSDMEPTTAIEALKAKGLGITFTEHVDYYIPGHGFDPTAKDKPVGDHDFAVDVNLYPQTYETLRNENTLLGLEIGLTAWYLPLNRQTALSYEYDFILGAVHAVDGYDLYHDKKNTFDYDRRARMLSYSVEMVDISDFIDALAHIDYISRYSPYPDPIVYVDEFAEGYDALLKALARRDIALEINTSRFGNPALEANVARICRRYHELGGRFCTIGSDGHNVNALGRYFGSALTMAREALLTPVVFKNRKRFVCE
jgi:histidinol-phosphatase (PHP family)